MTSGNRTPPARRFTAASIITVLVTVAAIAVAAVMFVTASQDALASHGNAVFSRTLLGIPVLDGFREGAHFGVHLHWGTWLFLVVPLLVGIGTSIPGARAFIHARN
jgi:hypothetical protein